MLVGIHIKVDAWGTLWPWHQVMDMNFASCSHCSNRTVTLTIVKHPQCFYALWLSRGMFTTEFSARYFSGTTYNWNYSITLLYLGTARTYTICIIGHALLLKALFLQSCVSTKFGPLYSTVALLTIVTATGWSWLKCVQKHHNPCCFSAHSLLASP